MGDCRAPPEINEPPKTCSGQPWNTGCRGRAWSLKRYSGKITGRGNSEENHLFALSVAKEGGASGRGPGVPFLWAH